MLDLPEAVEGQKPRHRPHAEAASAVVDHLHFAHFALPRHAQARQPLGAHEAHVAHDHDEGEVEQTHEERELQVEEDGRSKQIGPRAPLPDQERIGDLDENRAIGRDVDQPVVRCQTRPGQAVVVVVGGEHQSIRRRRSTSRRLAVLLTPL